MNLESTIMDVQRALGGIAVDGQAGPETWAALRAKLVPQAAQYHDAGVTLVGDTVDARSEDTISTLLPQVRPYARALVHRAAAREITIKIIGGTRTYAEQDALFAKRPPVTKARGGYSNHNFGIAFDIGIFRGAKYLEESPLYKVVGAMGVDLGLTWGGNWRTFVDEPHFELRPKWAAAMSENAMLAELRQRHAAGTDAFA